MNSTTFFLVLGLIILLIAGIISYGIFRAEQGPGESEPTTALHQP